MARVPSTLVILIAISAALSIAFVVLSIGESRKPFDLAAAERSDRGFYVGSNEWLHEKVEVQRLQVAFKVTEGGKANGGIFLDLYNLSNQTLSPTLIFVLPSDVVDVTASSSNATMEAKPYGKIVRLPVEIVPYGDVFPQPSVQFSWPTFGNSSRSGEYLFFIKGDSYPSKFTGEGNNFYQFQQSPANETIPITVSVYVAPYQLVDIYPESTAENFLGRAVWTPERTQTIYEAFGYYSDNTWSPILEYVKQVVLIALSVFGFAAAQRGFQLLQKRSKWDDGNEV